MLFSVSVVLLAIVMDYKFSEVTHYHPLVYFGNYVAKLEKRFNRLHLTKHLQRIMGIASWFLAVVPIVSIGYLVEFFLVKNTVFSFYDEWLLSIVVLYFTIGWRSLLTHAFAIIKPLKRNDIQQARSALSYIVSRDTDDLNKTQISNATTESVLENGADAIFSAIFWFVLAGVPGAILYRCVNTLDAMWGYKNLRFLHFGWMAARCDDVMNFIPARLTAFSYALLGNTHKSIKCWSEQGLQWKSPNAGPVMSAGAGAINIRLGGGSVYNGQWQERPVLGSLNDPDANTVAIEASCLLVDRVLFFWLFSLLFIALIVEWVL